MARYARLIRASDPECGPAGSIQNQPNPPTGSDVQNQPNPPAGWEVQNRPNPPTGYELGDPGNSGPANQCEPYREIIIKSLDQGLSRQRIWQDLRYEHEADVSYDSVKRFVRGLGKSQPLPFRRMECAPGEEAQVDFGTGAWVVTPKDQPLPIGVKTGRRKTYVFRIVLSHSRKAYSEAVYHQTTENFIRCLENAFIHFGGAPKTLVIDNLKAAVTKADWYDPELNPKIQAFAAHYGTVILPTKPRTPRHKGKVERGVDYVQNNALKGKKFASLAEQNLYLLRWEKGVADTRIHGTTRRQVKKCFEENEREALNPLPVGRFPSFRESKRKVGRDGYVEVDKAYYSVPPEYVGRSVWVRWDSHTVRIFNHRFEQLEYHLKHEPGQYSTHQRNIPEQKRSGVERGAANLLIKARSIGPHAGSWAESMIEQRGIEGVRVLLGLLSLSKKHSGDSIEQACETALSHGAYRLRTIRQLIKRNGDHQERFEFIDEHPIIRPVSDYSQLVHTAFTQEQYT